MEDKNEELNEEDIIPTEEECVGLMFTEISKEKVKEIIRQCEQNINDGCTDSLRSYEEGVKDTLEWLFCGSDEPILTD